ncbi:helix-turn-helix transcriptional regulator [Nonomuraea indica]|uniref:helix-turn-helix transcriptional regulator n=1 Tax=Nonomuraea indica TaxID=1581193 RepID=UPI000C7CC621|nr:LuxR C-terminal-related transcriptional regulator [Nonomuraea indica]
MPQPPRHNLPAEPNRFVGRDRDLDELCELLADTRVVTLCGVGGIGKTRLALRVAARLVPAYPAGVWLVELARIGHAEQIERELARVLGVREESGRPLLDTVAARLGDARCLLVLDNCEHLVDRCAEVSARLVAACRRLGILATSREPLRIAGELVWRVPPLDLPEPGPPRPGAPLAEAVRLFLDRAAAVGTRLGEESLADTVRLCRALDGLPLALELAAARTSMLSPGQIADRLDDRFSLLTTGGRTAPARQRTLLAAVEWSHDLLPAREQVLLRRLSVFAGAFDLDLAERVCAGPPLAPAEIVELLGGLVDKSLVQCDEDRRRYRLLETIKRFAAGRLADAGELDEVRDRHLGALCELQRGHFTTELVEPRVPWPRRLAALSAGRALVDDLRVALDWAVESRNVPLGLQLCFHSTGLLPVGGLTEIVGWAERLLALDLSGVPGWQVAQAKAYLAYGLEARDELERALRLAREAIDGLDGAGPYAMGVMHSLFVMVLLRLGRPEEALLHAQQGLELADAGDDPWNQASGLAGLSAVALVRGRLREAQRHGEEALRRAGEHGHRWIMARAATQLGAVAEARGDLMTAMSHYETAVPWLCELGSGVELARCLARGGRVAAMLHEFPAARERLGRSLALSRCTGQRQGVARCLVGLSVLAEAEGDLEGAVLTAAAAAGLREEIRQHSVSSRTEGLLARARGKLGDARTVALWARGRAMAPDEAARHVLDGAVTAGREGAAPAGDATVLPGAVPPAPQVTGAADEVLSPRAARSPSGVSAVGTVAAGMVGAVTALSAAGAGSPLTAREQEIAALLTRGLSNRAIAEELVISPATVARHIANIMDKLGHTSRAQIAVWAAEYLRVSA